MTHCSLLIIINILIGVCLTYQRLKVKQLDNQYIYMDYLQPQLQKLQPSPHQELPPTPLKIIPQALQPELSTLLQQNNTQNFAMKLLYSFYPSIDHLQYQYYNTKYNLDESIPELPMCIVTSFFNFISYDGAQAYLDNLENMNYSNFRVIMSDQMSKDGSPEKIVQMVRKEYPRLSRRLTVLKNREFIGSLGNTDLQVRNYCQEDSIIVEVDGSDRLLGKQPLNLINHLYHKNPQTWLLYTNFMYGNLKSQYFYNNTEIPLETLTSNTYRTSQKWVTSHLKTYRRAIYMKIPFAELLRRSGKYEVLGGEMHVLMPIVEMCGVGRIIFLEEFLYMNKFRKECGSRVSIVAEKLVRMKTPYLQLPTLTSQPQLSPNYTPPSHYLTQYNKLTRQTQQIKCLTELRKKLQDYTYLTTIEPPRFQQDMQCIKTDQAVVYIGEFVGGVVGINVGLGVCFWVIGQKKRERRSRGVRERGMGSQGV